MIAVAADPGAWGRAWHAPCAPAVTQAELVGLAAQAAGVVPSYRTVRPWMLRLLGRFVPEVGEMVELAYEFTEDLLVDWSDTEQRFGLAPTPLDEAIRTTVDWYRNEDRS